jgi:F-type H+-transporting ATPase subunit a
LEHPIIILPLFHIPPHVGITIYLIIGLAFLSYMVQKRISIVPNSLQSIIEIILEFLDNLIFETMGEKGKKYFPFVATFGIYILISNLLGLIPGLIPPTANLNTTLALALVVFISTHLIGIKEHGISYFKHFVGPIWWMAPLMLPIEIIGHLSRPVSLSLRLFGNMMGHEIIVATLLLLVPFLVPLPFLILGILVSLLQAFIFTLLTMMYIGGALEEAH